MAGTKLLAASAHRRRAARVARLTGLALAQLLAFGLVTGVALAKTTEIRAVGTFTQGKGDCRFPPTFRDNFIITFDDAASGELDITIKQPSTGDSVTGKAKLTESGTVSFLLDNGHERYEGTGAGKKLTADYQQKTSSCRHAYRVTFALAQPIPLAKPAATASATPRRTPSATPEPVASGAAPPVAVASPPGPAAAEGGSDTAWLPWAMVPLAILAALVVAVIYWKRREVTVPGTVGIAPIPGAPVVGSEVNRCTRCGRITSADSLVANNGACPGCGAAILSQWRENWVWFEPDHGEETARALEGLLEPDAPRGEASPQVPAQADGTRNYDGWGFTGQLPEPPPPGTQPDVPSHPAPDAEPLEDVLDELGKGPPVIS